ncbi:MAG TPA: HAD-IIB family hydrolase, partial [Micropepsaceae bacterium]|nr:HAD-IIB family hydrolase [Micropepsaceae bacterium]
FPKLDLFDFVVAENGALLYDPAAQTETPLAGAASPELFEALKARGARPLSMGRCIVATREPYQIAALEEIRRLGLELEIIFNKGAVMVLPSGVNKASGLRVALDGLRLSPHNVIGVGDAENDHAFLSYCGCSAAVANALPALRDRTHLVMQHPRGRGVAELIDMIIAGDGALMPVERHSAIVGRRGDEEIGIPAFGKTVLIAGRSGIGKSTAATALTEDMAEKGFQFCIFDPEGDYRELQNSVCVGDINSPPVQEEIFSLLNDARANVVINTLAIPIPQRPVFFTKVMPQIVAARARLCRPHWLIVDEAHHILPSGREDLVSALPYDFGATILITVHPETVSVPALKTVEIMVAIGPHAAEAVERFCRKTGRTAPTGMQPPGDDEVLFWRVDQGEPFAIHVRKPRQEHKRHTRKYAQGALSAEESFYFRGPKSKLNLRAQNTTIFLQIAEGVDDATWEHHLRKGEYSQWFRNCIKDPELADEVAEVERESTLDTKESRKRIAEAVNRRYTAPANAPDESA